MNRPLYAAVCFAALVTPFLAASPSAARPATPASSPGVAVGPLKLGDSGYAVTVVQLKLASMSYAVVVDGEYGTQTQDRVKRWQKANGLETDGLTGAETLRTLGLTPKNLIPVTGTQNRAKNAPKSPKTGQNDPKPAVEPPDVAPEPAVSTDDACAEMSQYRQAAGLPEQFDQIGYRESRCNNGVGNACCHGWWANYLSSHLSRQSAYRDRIINECGVTQVSDIRGDSEAQKRASACVTFVVWDVTRNLPGHNGMEPWAL